MLKTFSFFGGVHPKQEKLASSSSIVDAPLLPLYTVPLQMHIGAPAKALVQKGTKVLKGQCIAEASAFISASVHSPTSGTVKELSTCLGVNGTQWPALVIESDGEDKAAEDLEPIADWQEADPELLKARVAAASIVGMGGAAFPSSVKLSPPADKPIDTLIINGVECEPCLTADHRLMLEGTEKIIDGINIAARILGVKEIILAIEKNKPDAIDKMTEAIKDSKIKLCALSVRYPQGAEKQLIYSATGRIVPSAQLPMSVGCVVLNVATVYAIAEAVIEGTPLYERVSTITGSPIAKPGNWRLRVGTMYEDAVKLAGGFLEDPAKIIFGGPMMGISQYSLQIPITKNCSGLLFLSTSELSQFHSKACIRCGRCTDVCPMHLYPGVLSVQIESERFDLAEEWHVLDCIECGSCAFACPAQRPLVQHVRRAKTEVTASRQAAAAAKKKS